MAQVNVPGRYRFVLAEWGIREANKSSAMAFSYRAIALAKLNGDGTAEPIVGDAQESTGDIWFIRKTGQPDDTQVEFLRHLLKWDGQAASLLIPPGEPDAITPCEFVGEVKLDEYRSGKGEQAYRIDRIESDRSLIPHPTGGRRATLAEKLQAALDGRKLPVEPGGTIPGDTYAHIADGILNQVGIKAEPPQDIPF